MAKISGTHTSMVMLTAIIYYEQDKGTSPSPSLTGLGCASCEGSKLKQGFLKSFHQCSATFVQVKLQLKVQGLNNRKQFLAISQPFHSVNVLLIAHYFTCIKLWCFTIFSFLFYVIAKNVNHFWDMVFMIQFGHVTT